MATIKSFTLRNFKGADEVTVDLDGRVNCPVTTLIGLNESGKTTILEGLSHFVTGDKTVSSLFETGSKFDATTLIPIHKKAAFTGAVEVSANVIVDETDYEVAAKIASNFGLAINREEFLKGWPISKKYHFKDSVRTDIQNIWSLHLSVSKKSAKVDSVPKWNVYVRPKEESAPNLWNDVVVAIRERLPQIAYFPTFLVDMPHRIYLKEHKDEKPVNRYYRFVFQDILDSLDESLDLERHVCKRIEDFKAQENSPNWLSMFFGGPSKTTVDLVFQKISNAVTREVLGSWKKVFQLPISAKNVLIDWNIDTEKGNIPYASFYVSDGESKYAISERSLGFRWFFSFLLFTAFKKARERQTIFVFDEPAANLHAKAQAELLTSFSRIVADGNRVVYSTHSHHMIEPTWLSGAYIVENTAVDYDSDDDFGLSTKPTNVKATNYRNFVSQNQERTSYFQPVLEKLQYVTPALIGSPPFVIVEGITDFQVLLLVQRLKYPKPSFSIMPGTGAGASGALLSLLLGRGERFSVLLDDDKAGRAEAERYKEGWHLTDDTVFTLGALVPEFAGKKLEGLICAETRTKARAHGELSEQPTKKQLGWYFAEMCAIQCTIECVGAVTLQNVSKVLDALVAKARGV